MSKPPLLPGDPAPWFTARASNNPRFAFDTAAGRYLALTFVPSGATSPGRQVIAEIDKSSQAFDDSNASWFIVTGDGKDEATGSLPLRLPGIRAFFDSDNAVRQLYRVDALERVPVTFLISPRLQILAVVADADPARHAERCLTELAAQVPVAALGKAYGPAPVLTIPNVFEGDFCRMLIAGYDKRGGEVSGFMQQEDGKTVARYDNRHKVRRDWTIEDPKTVQAIQSRFKRRVIPEIQKAYNFKVTRMERYLVACYDAKEGGHFNPHRDNTTKGTAHRRFACSVNLNTEEYEGGNLRFPEFGRDVYRPPTGGCVIFGCSLLHEATLVTRGKRYAFLPFLYDDEAAKIREENRKYLDLSGSEAAREQAVARETAV
jgi:predicted 2-oxoglutarate/Fe(II)-dependent dioxygenase YbiX/peroxiredoxin